MEAQALELLRRTMDAQRVRSEYPAGFPALPPVPAGRYTDPEFAALEKEHLWSKSWLLAGIANEIPNPGDYLLFEQLDQSVILTRGQDGVVRAFHNVCRHRASALLQKPKGRAMRFVCPYHAWGYTLDGKLASVPDQHDFACLDKANTGLVPVRCEVDRGRIFVNFDSDAEPLADYMAPVAGQTEGYPLERMVVKHMLRVEMACNWKLAYHNFLEIYHVATVHARSLAPFLDSQSFVIALYGNGHMRFGTRKKRGETIFKAAPTQPDDIANVFRENTIALPTFPNTFFSLDPIGFSLQSFWPDGPDRSVMEVRMMGWESDSEADRDYWSGMREATQSILSEDLCLFASIQQGLRNGTMPEIIMGYQERALYWFEEEIDRRIGAERIPEALRIEPVLADQMVR